MDLTTGLVVFVFAISILTSFGSNKGYTPPAGNASSGTIYNEVSAAEPYSKYTSEEVEILQPGIQKYIAKYRSNAEAYSISDSILRYSKTYDVNPKLVVALIARESKFNPRAVSSSGAIGLGQLLPSTAQHLGLNDPYDIDQNVKGTVRYLRSLLDRFKGDVSDSIAAYLEGPNAVSRQGGYSYHTKTYVEDILGIYQKI